MDPGPFARPLLPRRQVLAGIGAALLPIPARAQTPTDAIRVIEARPARMQLLPEPAVPAEVWGYDGAAPGPLLRCRLGEAIRVRLVNRLNQPTAIHWRGVRITNALDGAAPLTQPFVPPGGQFDYQFTPPDAGTYLYQPALSPNAPEQLARGLHGVLIVDELQPPDCDLDFVAVVNDWRLDASGDFVPGIDRLPEAPGEGRAGSLVTVNSGADAQTTKLPPGARIRLRIVSACAGRILNLTLEGAQPLIIAIDGQACEAFEPVRRSFPAGPGSRFDVMFDLPAAPGQIVTLAMRGSLASEADRPLLRFETSGDPRPARGPIASCGLNPLLPEAIRLDRARRLDLVIATAPSVPGQPPDAARLWTLNSVASDGSSGKPLFQVRRGAPVALGFLNRTPFAHHIHVHGHVMRELHLLDDGWEPYWRDSVIVPGSRTVRVAFVADNPGKWQIHCAIPDHGAAGLAGWFEVT